jgi:hypothetical protein
MVIRRSILEYAQAIKVRYLKASKKGRKGILDEFVADTRLHRKAAIRLLNRVGVDARINTGEKRGRPRTYDPRVIVALRLSGKPATVCVPDGYGHFCRSWYVSSRRKARSM